MSEIAPIADPPHADLGLPSDVLSAPRVAVDRVILTAFRNHAHTTFSPNGRNVVLTGENGAGKTNILEALSFLTPGRGLRRAKLSDVTAANQDQAAWAVAVRLDGPDGQTDIGTGLDPDATKRERRVVRVDGVTERSQSVLSEHAAVVWLTPQMDGLFLDGPGGRRRFLDRLIFASDAAHAGRVNAYEQAMRERARLLSEHGTGADPHWLDALEATMVEKGMAVAAARRDIVGRLRAFIGADLGPFPRADLSLDGGPEGWLDDGPALAAEDLYRARLKDDRARDAADGRTSTGPHRTDMVVQHIAKSMPAHVCSTGEQKALLISLVLAHTRMQAATHGRQPILLLDEIAAHLDPERRSALFDLLDGVGAQTWMTGTDPSLFDGVHGRAVFFRVEDGAVFETEM